MTLQRFVDAQDPVWDDVLAELRAGRKRTHWMWFVFPQLAGLGRSATAQHYAIADLAEAQAYLAHPVLGARLRQACDLLLEHGDRTAHEVFGSPDDLKLRSSMTLFAAADPVEPRFPAVLTQWYDGPDDATVRLLG
ncbi:DUF1810 domain-containing protein [Klenkia sp. PcliD-1-E]|uniref:DUF1810 domain-containing protein n=1 Tax=Klenkia sp. PcliD-1-E TaxID=2954492 RepID=UPI002097C1FF|nr:DUF1810 domain-containing protein [Klenkia sp. PcliD-1-E]MCO7221621.1 DUF1810 domain-containing protein [Klenkia sp. PcliD-1-E]